MIVTSLVTIVSTLFGYGVVAARLRGKLDTVIYQQGAKNTWGAINRQRERIVRIETILGIYKEPESSTEDSDEP